ncbi:hypothetical protein [Caulobacter sp. S45]|uniref:hypothetical protein n=1 Tax=Caulobacter sp. S45 TaxID=1641861 RepID=UPI0015764B10|nr:hypothetical protein [Caulobacter sp. S45]
MPTLGQLEALGSERLWPFLLTIGLYMMVERVAEVCRLHFIQSMELGLGWATAPVQAALAMFWAYVAHRRLAFRGWTSGGKLAGAAVFVVISLGCLDLEFLMERLAPRLELGVWGLLSSFKFGLVGRLVWPIRPHRLEELA